MGETGYWKGETSRWGNGCDFANLLIKTYWSRKRRMKSKDKIQDNNMAIRNGLLKKLCGSAELLTFKTVKWRYRDKREDDVGTHSQKWQSTKTDQTIPSVQALQYNSFHKPHNGFADFFIPPILRFKALQLQYYSFEKPKTGRVLWLYLICPIPTTTR